ncbi:MAG: 2-amino-4-hydroxy-6-hydroxymethyldihydropteridine diphosphokinase [Deltaproteobacteria bacterium]|nr:2-amino-4-hydroxy-6-hydroxymethyldihydropteridine diphosphokinase [Deltaproteobacteria bacterium]
MPPTLPLHPRAPVTAYVALGANLGDRLANLQASCAGLAAAGVHIEARSEVFETDAVASDEQPAYLNAAIRVRTTLAPQGLLALAMDVERQLGRQRSRATRWAPRTADIDLLLYEGVTMDADGLTLPHPRLLERAFVRVPLAQVARPGLRHPTSGERLDEAIASAGVRVWPGHL